MIFKLIDKCDKNNFTHVIIDSASADLFIWSTINIQILLIKINLS